MEGAEGLVNGRDRYQWSVPRGQWLVQGRRSQTKERNVLS